MGDNYEELNLETSTCLDILNQSFSELKLANLTSTKLIQGSMVVEEGKCLDLGFEDKLKRFAMLRLRKRDPVVISEFQNIFYGEGSKAAPAETLQDALERSTTELNLTKRQIKEIAKNFTLAKKVHLGNLFTYYERKVSFYIKLADFLAISLVEIEKKLNLAEREVQALFEEFADKNEKIIFEGGFMGFVRKICSSEFAVKGDQIFRTVCSELNKTFLTKAEFTEIVLENSELFYLLQERIK